MESGGGVTTDTRKWWGHLHNRTTDTGTVAGGVVVRPSRGSRTERGCGQRGKGLAWWGDGGVGVCPRGFKGLPSITMMTGKLQQRGHVHDSTSRIGFPICPKPLEWWRLRCRS